MKVEAFTHRGGLQNDDGGVEHSNMQQLLKTDFYISDQQAKDAFLKIKAMENDPKLQYKKLTMNCVDGAAMIMKAIAESRPFDFFTEEQLSVHFDFFSNGKFTLPNPNTAPAVWYAQLKYRVSPLTISNITILLVVVVYNVVKCFCKKTSSKNTHL